MRITTLFLDIGGVLLTNGWDHSLREKTCAHFKIPFDEISEKHRLIFDTYENGKISLEEYLKRVIFYEPRVFSIESFKEYILNAASPYQNMIDLILSFKKKYSLKVGFVTNEGRELAEDRVKRFNLKTIADFFVISSCVHLRKPDKDIYTLALDVSQASPNEVLYIDDRKLFVEIARSLGLNSLHHVSYENSKSELEKYFGDKT